TKLVQRRDSLRAAKPRCARGHYRRFRGYTGRMPHRVGFLALVVVFSLCTFVLAKDGKGKRETAAKYDVEPVRNKLVALGDGNGHYLVLVPFAESEDRELFFYGDGKSFYRQRIFSFSMESNVSFSYSFWEPRVQAAWKGSFGHRDGKYVVRCDDRTTELKPLAEAESRQLIDAASFYDVRWKRYAYALARDEKGVYYYVDRMREPEGNRDFRLFVGPVGALKLAKMKNIVSDSEGDIFSTRGGELRLVLGKGEASWIKGKSRASLKVVPVQDNAPLIYGDLGVYTGEPLGTPCDDL
ncbi:MAG: hypothetical protein V2A73_22155, partial [Pseudomonadota bacterium]